MDAVALVLEHSVEADVSRAFAWKFRTNVAIWNDPPATFVLDGAFTDGGQGSTVLPGQTPLTWWVRDVTNPMRRVEASSKRSVEIAH